MLNKLARLAKTVIKTELTLSRVTDDNINTFQISKKILNRNSIESVLTLLSWGITMDLNIIKI